MFTGIVQGTAPLSSIVDKDAFRVHTIELEPALREGLEIGASVSHNGVCLTVTGIDGGQVSFDLMRETLRLTNLGELGIGDFVNIERAARFGDEIGGHAMSGHVVCTAELTRIEKAPNNRRLWFTLPRCFGRFLFDKGYIGLDGISLTIGEVRRPSARGSKANESISFCVNLIPETLARTTLGSRRNGDRVNIEIDPQTQAIVETVERVLAERSVNL